MVFILRQCLFAIVVLLTSNVHAQQTFTNPLLPAGADPWCFYKDGYYYYTNTTGGNITIWKTNNIATLSTSESKVIWTPPDSGSCSKEIWAPEIHFIRGKWYVYFSADNGKNINHRLYVLENASPDPLVGSWIMKGKLTTPEDKWSIDGSVFEHKGKMYLIWSGWKGDVNGQQDIYMARMKNPWTVEGKRALISSPTYDWEKVGAIKNPEDPPQVNVNEGPEVLRHGNKLFLIYSASGCWTDAYSLGMLSTTADKDIMNPASWTKNSHPVFTQSVRNKVYATGHNSFFKSPDGKEDFILYHANSKPGEGCGTRRSPRAQKFKWNRDGTPDFGEPVPEGTEVPVPSGTIPNLKKHNPVLDLDFPDPTVIRANGRYYAYATQAKYNGRMLNIQVASSKDLFNWKHEGDALPAKPVWASHTQDFWAPHVLYDSGLGSYVMFYCAKSNDTSLDKCIGVAFSRNATGPFVDKGTPLIEGKGFADIDPMAMTDPATGKKILYWGSGFEPIRGRELRDDWKDFEAGSTAIPLIFPDKEKNYSALIEGAWVDCHDGKYYLYYSGDNCCGDKANYAVMVARADHALGPFESFGEAGNAGSSVILEQDSIWKAPGHNSIVKDPAGDTWIVYHAIWKNKAKAGPATGANHYLKRVMCVEPVVYKNGWPVIVKKY